MKKIVLLTFVLVLLSTATLGTTLVTTVSGSTTHHVYPGDSIQEAVNLAQPGDTIFVHCGTYYEHVIVNRSVSLIGENKYNTIIDGGGYGTVVRIWADGVKISNFTVRNVGPPSPELPPAMDGILASLFSNGEISNNIIENNGNDGIYLVFSNNNTITGNRVSENEYGIRLDDSSNNTITSNNVSSNKKHGICLLLDCAYNVLTNNKASENEYGICIDSSSNNTLADNQVFNNDYGIHFFHSPGNIIIGNEVLNNNYGIYLDYSRLNSIYNNNFTNNTCQAYAFNCYNTLDNGTIGNYWSDYNGTDNNRDGIGDTPYVIDENNQDNYPLTEEGGKFKPYVSTFHVLFEDGSHNLLGNLSGELRITEYEKEIIRSVCKLSLSSPRPDEYHEPYIDKVELFTGWTFIIHSWGPGDILVPPPATQEVTVHVDEEIILFERSHNVSGFVEEPRLFFSFSRGTKIWNHEWDPLILPTIRVYFSDGQEWEWEYEYDITPPFKLWSGMDVNLSELSGKIETASITFTTVEKVSPPIIDLLIYLYIILASIIVAIAVAVVFVKYRKKQQTPSEKPSKTNVSSTFY